MNLTDNPMPDNCQQLDQAIIVDAYMCSDIGRHRTNNEDRIKCTLSHNARPEKGLLAVVADGMGGHQAGEEASQLAVDTICSSYFSSSEDAQTALANALYDANLCIAQASQCDPKLDGMGTTATAIVLKEGLAYAAHVGDSRLYLVRNGEAYQLTEDHTMVMEWFKRGIINRQEALNHPDRNILTQSLGTNSEVKVETWAAPLAVRPGDRLVLCTDGLHDLLCNDDIVRLTNSCNAQTACEQLICLANQRGGFDNISVGILNLLSADRECPNDLPDTRLD